MNKITLAQSTPGSWSGIDILVDGTKKFYASKQGTSFWVIVSAEGNCDRIGYGGSKTEIKRTVSQYLVDNPQD
jgi:hypothetical protein